MTQRTASDGVTSEGGVWGVGDPKDKETLHGEVEPGAVNQDTTVSQLTDALDSDALVSSDTPEPDAMGSER